MQPTAFAPRFPYMAFARTEGFSAPHPLTQSGMPPADAALFDGAPGLDLSYAGARALPELQERIAARYGVAAQRVIVTLGASGAMHALAQALFAPGVRVVSEVPSYEPLRALPPLFGADGRLVARRADSGWDLDPAQVRAELAGAREGHVLLSNPNNPTGAWLSAQRLRELAEEAARAGGLLLSNEIYMEYAAPSSRHAACDLAPNGVSMGSLTKAYGLGALRCGWIVLGEGAAHLRARIEDALFLTWVDPPTLTLRQSAWAFDRLELLRAQVERVEAASKPLFARWLAAEPLLEGREPASGLTAFPRAVGVADTLSLQRHLAAEHGVGVVPGEFFGTPGHLRVGFGLPPEALATALERLSEGLAAFGRSPA